MRVAFVTQHLSHAGGGIFYSATRLAQTLHEQGTAVDVLGLADEFLDKDLPAWAPLKPESFRVTGPATVGYAPALYAALSGLPADLAHCHGIWTHLSASCLRWARHTKKPYLVSPHGMLDSWALKNSRWKKRLARLLYQDAHLKHAACIHALCDAETAAVRDFGLTNPVCVIPNGIDLPAPTSTPPPWRETIPAGHKVLFYLGRLHPKKGLVNLVRAWADAGKDAEDWHLVIAGWDQQGHLNDLKSLAREAGAERLHFPGAQFDAAKTASFHACDAFVLPSFSEGLPMVVLEAWAHSKPVLMTRACNLPEGFAAGAAIEIGPENIARGLRELFSKTDAERRAIGALGRGMVETRFTWPVVAAEMLAVYRWVTGQGPQPSCVVHA